MFVNNDFFEEDINMKKLVCLLLVLVLVFAMSVSVFADNAVSPENGNTDVEPNYDPNSPQTGDTGAIYWVVTAMVLAVGAAAFCGVKLVNEK